MKKLLFLFFLYSFGIKAQTNTPQCQIPPDTYKNILANVKTYGIKSVNNTSPVLYDWPVKQVSGFNDPSFWAISNYFDHNPAVGQVQDYNCGTHTYDVSGYNHSGTDIYPAPFGWLMMDANQVDIVAAADGVIVGKIDGNFDKNCNFNNPQWNAVVLQHADGTITMYGHMKIGSLTSKALGSTVAKGEFLGKVGSSGQSTGPHLHFECIDTNGNPFDPFTGTCNTGTSRWLSQKSYYDSGLLKITTNSSYPTFNTCPTSETENLKSSFAIGESVLSITYLRAPQQGQSVTLKIYNPGNALVNTQTITISNSTVYDWYEGRTYLIPSNAPTGTWKLEVTYLGQNYTKNFTVTCSPPAAPNTQANSRCGTGTVSLSASGCSGTYNWYGQGTNGTSLATGATFTSPSLTASKTYYVSCTVSGCTSSTRSAATATINAIPNAPTVNGVTINAGQTATLSANSCSGIVNWYAATTGGSSLGSGASFTTPVLSNTTNYYASCTVNSCVSTSRTQATVTVLACPKPTATLSGTQTITSGQSANLTVTLTGTAPWSIQINGQTYSNINSSPYIISVSPSSSTTYALSTTSNSCGMGTSSGIAVITVNPAGCDLFEPNNTIINAKLIPFANYQSPEVCLSVINDEDWYKVIINDNTVFIKVSTGSSGATGNYYLKTNILNTSIGQVLEIFTLQGSGTNTDTKIENYKADGITYLSISDNSGTGSLHTYTNIIVPKSICMESLDLHKNVIAGSYKSNSTK